MSLFRSVGNTFKVIIGGEYASVLTNGGDIFVHKKFAEIFESVPDQVSCLPVKIIDKAQSRENEDYLALTIQNTLNPLTIDTLDTAGRKVWKFSRYLFVSDELKNELESIADHGLRCTLGFSSGFA